jgi:hypothetical protein
MSTTAPRVAVVMGSKSDWETMRAAVETLEEFAVPTEARVVSAHRTPELMFDFARTAVITDSSAAIPPASDAIAGLKVYDDAKQEVVVVAPATTFLASSEKLTPELRVTIDGREVKPVMINLLFAGVPVPAGTHAVVFSRRLARGWWPLSGAALLLLIVISVIDVRRYARSATKMI